MWFDLHRCDPDRIGPHTIAHDAVIPATPHRVFEILCDEESWPRWFPYLVRSRWLTAEPHGVGSLRRADMRGGLSVIEHFVVFRPGERMTFFLERATLPLVSHAMEDYRLSPAPGGGTWMQWRVHYRVRRPVRPLHPVVRPLFDGMFGEGIRNLAAYAAAHSNG